MARKAGCVRELQGSLGLYGQPESRTSGEIRPLTCIDLFAGCGGLSLGLEQAGFQPLLFSEINESAAATYVANRQEREIVAIGDIYGLTNRDLKNLKGDWEKRGIRDLDLVCGGPPCQGYSGIGHRRTFRLQKKEIPSNQLFQEMVRVVRFLQPRAFLFENVKGLLTAKWTSEGTNGEIFRDVLSAFQQIPGYHIRWQLVHAKDYGVPQNRPRVLMVGLRADVVSATMDIQLAAPDPCRPSAIQDGFLPPPKGVPPSLEQLLSDLEDPDYLGKKATTVYPRDAANDVQRQFRRRPDGRLMRAGHPLAEQEYSEHAPYIREKFAYMISHGGEIPEKFRTKKFAQRVFPRVWGDEGPNITATSLPQDYVHYSQAREPTVREWARIQTFPDWYVFKGPRTTGGRRRAGDPSIGVWTRDVPKFTQIGNAVPVWLARQVGQHLASILRGCQQQ